MNMTKNLPMKRIFAAELAKQFVTNGLFNYGLPVEYIAYNRQRQGFRVESFPRLVQDNERREKVHNHLSHDSNAKIERYNQTIFATIRTYIADNPGDRELCIDVLTFSDICQPHISTSVAPLERILSKPPGPLEIKPM